jgi:hypothetical protein
MTCLTTQQLAAELNGELTHNDSLAARAHLATCASCRQLLLQLERVVETLPTALPAREDPAFVGEVLAKLQPRRSVSRWAWATGAAVAAGLGLWMAGLPSPRVPEFTARGGSGSGQGVGFTAYVHPRSAPGTRHSAVPHEVIRLGDGFSFELTNRTGRSQFVALFGLDSRGESHWFYPGWREGQQPPLAVPLAAAPEVTSLADGVTPEGVAPGDFQLVAVFVNAPISVSEVERLLRDGGLVHLKQQIPDACVRTLELNEAPEMPR